MGKDGIKISFGGTREIIGGAGRSPQSFCNYGRKSEDATRQPVHWCDKPNFSICF